MPEKTGLPIRFAPAGDKPDDVMGHLWVYEMHPSRDSGETTWQWALYGIKGYQDNTPIYDGGVKCEP